jgi:hypothetical protein
MLLGAFYTPKGYPFSFSLFLIDMFNTYNNLNFFIKRAVPYVQEGRVQTEAESDKKAVAMQKFLKTNKIPYMPINGDEDAINTILATITKKHK